MSRGSAETMEITIIGTGNMAHGIATRALAGGHSVTLLGTEAAKAKALADELSGNIRAGQVGDPLSGDVVAANLLGEPREANYDAVPRVTFTDPQAGAVGAVAARYSGTADVSEVAKTATYTRAYAESNGFLTLLSDGERLTGAYALGQEAGEWLQQATLAIRARVPVEVLRDTIQPFPTFSEIYIAALKALHGEITTARQALVGT